MENSAWIELEFGDDIYPFCLDIGGLRDLREKTGIPEFKAYLALTNNDWHTDLVHWILRVGLYRAGMKKHQAEDLVKRYYDPCEKITGLLVAQQVLGAALFGREDDLPPKKAEPEEQPEEANSPSVNS